MQSAAIRWLAQKDEESERLRLASQAEQIEIARSAKDAAWTAAEAALRAATAAERANTRATIALIIAAISIAITVASSFVSHVYSAHSNQFSPQPLTSNGAQVHP
jgi:hypothetical protein